MKVTNQTPHLITPPTLKTHRCAAKDYTDFNMYRETARYARRRLLTPRTEGGRALLKQALLTAEGRRALLIGFQVRFFSWVRAVPPT
jgi:hypothetical protein